METNNMPYPTAMQFVMVPQKDWERIITALEKVEARLEPEDRWIGTKEACKMLNISINTWLNYRKRFKIKTSQVGRNVLVLKSDIDKLLKMRTL